MSTFPALPEALRADWLTTILHDASVLNTECSVNDFSVESIGDGVGLLGMVVRVELAYDVEDTDAPKSVVMKFAHPVAANRDIAMLLRMYEREVVFYTQIAHHVDVPKPDCYFAEVDHESGEVVVVLEDMRRYRVADQLSGVDVNEAKMVIDAIAPLHAKYWGDTDQELLSDAMRIDTNWIELLMPSVEGTWENCVSQFGYCIADDVRDELGRYMDSLRSIHKMMGDRTQTLIHGDVRADNVLFGDGKEPYPAVLVDWQALMVSNPLHDLACMVSQSLTTETRRAHDLELVTYYHESVSRLGVSNYSLEQCLNDYDAAVLYLLSYSLIIGGAFDPANDRGKQLAEAVLRRASQAVSDRGLLALIPN